MNIPAHVFGECLFSFLCKTHPAVKVLHHEVDGCGALADFAAEFSKLAEPSFHLDDTLFSLKTHVFPLFWGNPQLLLV